MLIRSTSGPVPCELYTAEQVRRLDALAIAEIEGGGYALMRRAGKAAFRQLLRHFPECRSLAVFCGGGNNGGDGYVIAELALTAGLQVSLYALVAPEKLTGEAAEAWQQAQQQGVKTEDWGGQLPADCDVIVDALLGTGLSGSVRGDYVEVIKAINATGLPVVAIDVPSGLSADTGMPLGPVIKADLTSTFIGIKRGLLTGLAADYVGELWFDDLGVSKAVYARENAAAQRDSFKLLQDAMPLRRLSDHKGRFGHVLIIGGDTGFGGAALMASEAALRAGAGLVSCATQEMHVGAGLVRCPEVMFKGVSHRQVLEAMLVPASVVVLGPGLGQGPWGQMCFQTALQHCLSHSKPMVMDADALNMLAMEPLTLPRELVLTPHPGEAARLLACSVADVMQDRFASVRKLAEKYQATVVLKGAGTLVASSADQDNKLIAVCAEHGNPGMASGGMGDVLAGIVAALIAQGIRLFDATRLAVAWHAHSGDMALCHSGQLSLTATDVIRSLGPAWVQPELD